MIRLWARSLLDRISFDRTGESKLYSKCNKHQGKDLTKCDSSLVLFTYLIPFYLYNLRLKHKRLKDNKNRSVSCSFCIIWIYFHNKEMGQLIVLMCGSSLGAKVKEEKSFKPQAVWPDLAKDKQLWPLWKGSFCTWQKLNNFGHFERVQFVLGEILNILW